VRLNHPVYYVFSGKKTRFLRYHREKAERREREARKKEEDGRKGIEGAREREEIMEKRE
jgi:hypothetical protein